MPIQFRCPSCDRMLGIAKRKAGSTVKCPRCATDVSVPALAGMAIETNGPIGAAPAIPKGPSGGAATASAPAPAVAKRAPQSDRKVDSMPLFERPDFESLLNPALEKAKPEPAVPLPEPRRVEVPPSKPYLVDPVEEAIDVEDLSNTIILTRSKLTIAVAIVALLMGIAFAAGYFLATAMVPTRDKSSQVIPGKGLPYLEG